MGYWRKHQRKELEEVLAAFDAAGWTIEPSKTRRRTIG